MSDQYYLRVRGSVVGPFREDQVRQLIERGKLGRFHEVSVDKATWQRLENFPQLLPRTGADSSAEPTIPTPQGASEQAAAHPGQRSSASKIQPVAARAWYYALEDGTQHGPEDESVIVSLISAGKLSPTTLVWTAGMPRWVALRESPLAVYLSRQATEAASPAGTPEISPTAPSSRLPRELVTVATGSIPWARATIIVWGIGWSCMLVAQIALAFLVPSAVARVVNFLVAIYCGFSLWNCVICFFYTNSLSALRYTNSVADLSNALKRLKLFWIWATVLVLVAVALGFLSLLLLIAGGVDLMNAVLRP